MENLIKKLLEAGYSEEGAVAIEKHVTENYPGLEFHHIISEYHEYYSVDGAARLCGGWPQFKFEVWDTEEERQKQKMDWLKKVGDVIPLPFGKIVFKRRW
jgi:hypothetical protein